MNGSSAGLTFVAMETASCILTRGQAAFAGRSLVCVGVWLSCSPLRHSGSSFMCQFGPVEASERLERPSGPWYLSMFAWLCCGKTVFQWLLAFSLQIATPM